MARVVVPGSPHHITQRGIRRSDIFRDQADRELYLKLFDEASHRFKLRVCAYCLMTNHVHFIAIPEDSKSIWKTLQRCHEIYAARFNQKYGLSGHLWQGRAFSCVLSEAHFWSAVRYVERNPVRAGMVAGAQDYRWSSARAHCDAISDNLLAPEWAVMGEPRRWAESLRDDGDENVERIIRKNTFTGRPCGNADFVRDVETKVGRRLSPRKPGPKPKVAGAPEPSLWASES
jgi:putative transposase